MTINPSFNAKLRALEPLIAALKDESIVLHAVYALGQIGDSSAIPALRSFLITDDNRYRFRLAYSFALCGDAPAIDDLDLVCAVSEDPERVILVIHASETTCKRHPMLASRIIPISPDGLATAVRRELTR